MSDSFGTAGKNTMSNTKLLNRVVQAKIHRMFENGFKRQAIANETGVKRKAIDKYLMFYRDWQRGLRDTPYAGESEPFAAQRDPTPEEIAERAAEIRKGW